MESKNILYVAIFLVGIVAIMSLAFVFGPNTTDQSGDEGTETPNNIIIITHETLTWKNSTINVGTNITWINKDFAVNHHIIGNSSNFTFDSGVLKNGENYTLNFTKVGTFQYHDAQNPALSGTITVK
jgi:plastocyanin